MNMACITVNEHIDRVPAAYPYILWQLRFIGWEEDAQQNEANYNPYHHSWDTIRRAFSVVNG